VPRPMTTYRSGIETVTRYRDEPCLGCGKVQHRKRRFSGTPGEIETAVDTWTAVPVYCIPCWRKAGRPQA